MNNLQYIVRFNTRYAMHVGVELCEQGDFDDVFDAVRWLMQERELDEISYKAGFDNGVKACLQILDGYLEYPHSALENIMKWVDEQWKEVE